MFGGQVLSHWCWLFARRCGVLLASCCGTQCLCRRFGVLGAVCCGSDQLGNTDVAASQRVCRCGAVPGQSVDSLEDLCRVVNTLGNFQGNSASDMKQSLHVVVQENYWIWLERTYSGISCRSSCTMVSSIHFQLPRSGREVEQEVGEIH